jgi:uncharacterized protein YdaU (DUF1376 family)
LAGLIPGDEGFPPGASTHGTAEKGDKLKPKEHYLPLFVGDFLASTATWTGPERGLYLQLLMTQWASGPLPADRERLALSLHYPHPEFERLWPAISAKFRVIDGTLVNERLEEIRVRSAEIQISRSKKSRAAANARWNAPSNAPSMPQALPVASAKQCSRMPSDPIRSDPIQEGTDSQSLSVPKTVAPRVATVAETVFEHWKSVWGHPRATLDAKRAKTIKAALQGYSAEDLCLSISGYLNSPHHSGQNDRNTVYDDIGLLLRDAAHIDAGLAFAARRPTLHTESTTHNIAALRHWRPGEDHATTDRRRPFPDPHGDLGGSVRQETQSGDGGDLLGRIEALGDRTG